MLQKPSVCRLRQRCSPRHFRERLTCAVQHHPDLTAEDIAAKSRVRYDRLLKYCSDPTAHVPAEVLRDIVASTGRIDLFDALLFELGYYAARLDGPDQRRQALLESVLDVQVALGRLSERVREATRNAHINAGERQELLDCVKAVRRELADVEAPLLEDAASVAVAR